MLERVLAQQKHLKPNTGIKLNLWIKKLNLWIWQGNKIGEVFIHTSYGWPGHPEGLEAPGPTGNRSRRTQGTKTSPSPPADQFSPRSWSHPLSYPLTQSQWWSGSERSHPGLYWLRKIPPWLPQTGLSALAGAKEREEIKPEVKSCPWRIKRRTKQGSLMGMHVKRSELNPEPGIENSSALSTDFPVCTRTLRFTAQPPTSDKAAGVI